MIETRGQQKRDLCDVFAGTAGGYIPLVLPGNQDLETDDRNIQLEPTWPGCLEQEVNEMKFTIENGVEIPKSARQRNSELSQAVREALQGLAIGQSFLIPCEDKAKTRKAQTLVLGIIAYMRPKLFATRSLYEGLRIWRLE